MTINSNRITLLLLFFCTLCVTDLNASGKSVLTATKFPTTASDAFFTTKTQNAQVGYLPYKNIRAFQEIELESEEEYLNRLIRTSESRRQHDFNTMTRAQYCKNYPLDDKYCPQTTGLYEATIAIGNRPSAQPSKPPRTTTHPHPAPTITPHPTQPEKTTKPGTSEQPAQPAQPIEPEQPAKPEQPAPTATGKFVGYNASGRSVYADKTISGGPCTLPQRSNHWPNKILTTGKYEQIDPAFEKAMITVFRKEGDCVNDPSDSGGYTCYGVSQRNNPEVNVSTITRADAEQIGYNKYYAQYNMHALPDHIRGDVFQMGWNAGPGTAIKRLCDTLHIPQRTRIDDGIVDAAKNYTGDLHNDFWDVQQQYYIEISKRGDNKKFLTGWMNGVRLSRENGCHTETTDPLLR